MGLGLGLKLCLGLGLGARRDCQARGQSAEASEAVAGSEEGAGRQRASLGPAASGAVSRTVAEGATVTKPETRQRKQQ